MESVMFSGSLGYMLLEYEEYTNMAANTSTIVIYNVYVMETGWYGRNVYPDGIITVNGQTAFSFNRSPEIYTWGVNEWIHIDVPQSAGIVIPHNSDGRGTVTFGVTTRPDSGYGAAFYFFDAQYSQRNIVIPAATVRRDLTWIPRTPPTVSISVTPDSSNQTVKNWGIALQGYSVLKASVTATPASGLTISGYRIEFSATEAYNTQQATSAIMTDAVRRTVTGYATDNAGLTGSASAAIDVVPYSRPSIDNIECYRCNASGTPSETGAYFYVKGTATYSSCAGKNSATLYVRYKQRGTSNWSGYTQLTSGVGAILGGALEAIHSYDVQLLVQDALTSATIDKVITTARTNFSIGRSGDGGVAFGKYAEYDKSVDIQNGWYYRIDGDRLEDLFFPVGSVIWNTTGAVPPHLAKIGQWQACGQVITSASTTIYAFMRVS